jgi:hypothetical protein
MDTLCTKLRRFWHIPHLRFIRNALNNYQCNNCSKNRLQRQVKNISQQINFFVTFTVFEITTFSDETSVNVAELLHCVFIL